MANTPITTFRIAPELLAKVDAYAAKLEEAAGVPVSRNAAVVRLLKYALDRTGRPKRPAARPRR